MVINLSEENSNSNNGYISNSLITLNQKLPQLTEILQNFNSTNSSEIYSMFNNFIETNKTTQATSEKLINFNNNILDIFNTTGIGSNTIILCFWVHSKYQFKDSSDKSSSIVIRSSISTSLYYIFIVVICFFSYKNVPANLISNFILFHDRHFYIMNRSIYKLDLIYKFVNSLYYLLLINFYFIVIKEVILRKHVSKIFRGKK